jgi:oxygen-independent coproporphyrinogen III oxidase
MTIQPRLDADLLRRYDRPGPRYTSYPTAPQFNPAFGETQLREAVAASNGDPIPRRLSLYVHVPFCASPCFYCGCNRIITRDKGRAEGYLARLYREIDLVAALFDRDREVIQLHFGGGTPNFLTPAQLREVVDTLRRQFHFADRDDADISIELDPRFVTPRDVAELGAIGFNRASLGVQDFDPVVQAAVNRIQSVEETTAVVEACRDAGMRSVNIDLIYGLPKQTLDGFGRTLEQVIAIRPDRLAVYGYAHLPELFRPQRRIEAADLPSSGNPDRTAAAGDRAAHRGRLHLHRHGPFRTARRRARPRPAARRPAPQLHGLHHPCRQRPGGPGGQRDQPCRRHLQPEPARPAELGSHARRGPPAGRARACGWTRTTSCAQT